MKALLLTAVTFITILQLPAQVPSIVGIIPQPVPPQPSYPQIRAYLNLTDAQVQALVTNLTNRSSAQQAIYKQMNDKQIQLNMLLSQGTSDALTVGQLEIDINNLRKQLPLPNSSYRQTALGVLTPDQTAKLAALINALQLQNAAFQAITLDLIDAPAPVAPPPLPAAQLASELEGPVGAQ